MAESPLGLVVADYVGRQVVIVDPTTLEVLDALPIYTDDTQLDRGKPLSVGWMNGRLYVGEEYTGRIQVYAYGKLKKGGIKDASSINKGAQWVQTSSSLTAAPLIQPSAIAADEVQGLLFVASKGEKAVLVLDADGNLLRTIGAPGSADPLGKPQGIALDTVGSRVFVSDDGIENCTWMGCSLSSAIQVYNYDGLLLASIDGSDGNAGYQFSRAQGVALDAAGHVYLADSYRHEVMVFEEFTSNSFSALGLLGGKGSGPGQLLLPTGVFVDAATSRMFVANTMLSRIEVFGMEDLTP
jgi:DNA-binding beta-propeller fold protein YncE